MAKLIRYSSFEELKSAPLEKPLTPEESAKAHAEFEEGMRRLQQEFATQKTNTASTELTDLFGPYRGDETADETIEGIISSRVSNCRSESLDS